MQAINEYCDTGCPRSTASLAERVDDELAVSSAKDKAAVGTFIKYYNGRS